MSAPDELSSSEGLGASSRSRTTIEDEIARLDQALLDLKQCEATSVGVTHCPSPGREATLIRELTKTAWARGFVTAHVSLDEHPLDAIEGLVAALLDALVPPGEKKARGLLGLLDSFFERHGVRSVARFEEACDEQGAAGDLRALCSAYLEAEDDAQREVKAFSRWAEGEVLGPRQRLPGVRGSLNAHTGQRILGELSRLIRALGYGGFLVALSRGDCISERTERQREKSYTLLRELVDNFDSGRGAVSTRIVITGGDALFLGERSLRRSSAALRSAGSAVLR